MTWIVRRGGVAGVIVCTVLYLLLAFACAFSLGQGPRASGGDAHWVIAEPAEEGRWDLQRVDGEAWNWDENRLLAEQPGDAILIEVGRFHSTSSNLLFRTRVQGIRIERFRAAGVDEWVWGIEDLNRDTAGLRTPLAQFLEQEIVPDGLASIDDELDMASDDPAMWFATRWETVETTPEFKWGAAARGAFVAAAIFIPLVFVKRWVMEPPD